MTCSACVGDDGVAELGDPWYPYYIYAVMKEVARALFYCIFKSMCVGCML